MLVPLVSCQSKKQFKNLLHNCVRTLTAQISRFLFPVWTTRDPRTHGRYQSRHHLRLRQADADSHFQPALIAGHSKQPFAGKHGSRRGPLVYRRTFGRSGRTAAATSGPARRTTLIPRKQRPWSQNHPQRHSQRPNSHPPHRRRAHRRP